MTKVLGAALLFLFLLTGTAAAQRPDPNLSIARRRLTDTQRVTFDILYQSIMSGEKEIRFSTPADYDDVAGVMTLLAVDFPQLCGLGSEWRIIYYRDHPQDALGVQVSYECENVQERREQLMDQAQHLVSGISGSDFEREQALHDLLLTCAEYHSEGAMPHDAWGALCEGRAVCEGYAKAMVLLCRLSGIPCSIITGTADDGTGHEHHAWVMLELEGVYTQTDPTWDDVPGLRCYDYFNLPDGMIGVSHERDAASKELPLCESDDVNWHAMSGSCAPAGQEFRQFLHQKRGELLAAGCLSLRFASRQDLETALDFFSRSMPIRYRINEQQLCLTILLSTTEETSRK